MSDSSSLAGSEVISDDGAASWTTSDSCTAPLQDAQNVIPSKDLNVAVHATGVGVLQDAQNIIPSKDLNIAGHATGVGAEDDTSLKTQKNQDRYLRRFQIWDRAFGVWKPYDPSFIKPVPPREDLHNYFYLDVRHKNSEQFPELVVSHFSGILIKFLRHAIGDEFFERNPEYRLSDFFSNLRDLKADLAEVCDVLASNLAEEDLKQKANDMGCTDALGLHKTEKDARLYFEDVVEHLGVLLGMIEQEFEPTAKELELQLSYGSIAYDLLEYYFEPGVKYYTLQNGNLTGFTLDRTCYSKHSERFSLVGETTRWDGHKYTHKEETFQIEHYDGTMELPKLPCKIMTDDVRAKLTARGKLYESFAGGVHYKSYKGSRIVIDQLAFDKRPWGYERDPDENIPDVPEGEYDQLPASVPGFELKSKTWQSFCVEEIGDIKFDEKAWDHLVIDDDVKSLIKGLVDVTKNANTSQHLMSDVITGKGGGLIAVLHGPPGTGKTLTAEAVAEHLKRPLYIVSSPELSTVPSQLESKLSEILSLATTWDAIVLIDEADVFLEQRSLRDLTRNALVSVALKVFEYHRGVLFLTTNRIQTFDDAFLSRFSIGPFSLFTSHQFEIDSI
ncbi:P-loop containing nucleoside triphosphate hydrolase protein [Suillus clintonianus]|uniref:P-loop containing nucleoside triphosphate hydrolase protein n=1 Tax=Suillus clintonianus TaxID=1904413 RepID=UPI001B8636A6|nr:P-loop containing nucleoside triphosphate hydrolase protein [Suillus clintonianus]KAG2156420.1 P-loop containing nucleoside triphosphate hydrolase protein [Suillus clintonianus]